MKWSGWIALYRWSGNIHYNKKSESGNQISAGSNQQAGCMGSGGGLTVSSNKTVSMIFKQRNEESLEIMIRNEIIPSKESTQFLVMTLKRKLNWGNILTNWEPKQREH